ncbi:MAG: class I SAM-dependent methyltransferase [Thermofilaceae archaeon]
MSLSYDLIAERYDELYSSEQLAKHRVVLSLAPPVEPVLDAGCGTGMLLEALEVYGVGLDSSKGMLQVAKRRLTGRLVDLVQADAEKMPFRSCSFAAVYSVTVLHEAPALLGEALTVLKTGGLLAATLLRKKLELLPQIAGKLENVQVFDYPELKDLAILCGKPAM